MNIIASFLTNNDNRHFTNVVNELQELIGEESILELARQTGFVQRIRDFNPGIFIKAWLSLCFTNNAISIDSLYANYVYEASLAGGRQISETAFENQLNKPQFVQFARELMSKIMQKAEGRAVSAPGKMAQTLMDILKVDQVLITDGSEICMTDQAGNHPGQDVSCRSSSGYGKKAHTTLNMLSNTPACLSVGAAASGEVAAVPLNKITNSLWFADAGYTCYDEFKEIDANGSFFIVRGRQNETPKVTAIRVLNEDLQITQQIDLKEPVKLNDVISKFGGKLKEVEILTKSRKLESFDLDVILSNGLHSRYLVILSPFKSKRRDNEDLYVYMHTNIPHTVMSAEQIMAAYHGRWSIERLFHQSKQHNGLHAGKIQKGETVEAFICLSMCSQMLKSIILQHMEASCGKILSNTKGQKYLSLLLRDICSMIYVTFDALIENRGKALANSFKALCRTLRMSAVSRINRIKGKSLLVREMQLRGLAGPVVPIRSPLRE